MAGSVNRATILGNLGQDPDIRQTQDGRKIVNLSIATSESWTDRSSGERRERTQRHRVVLFNEGLAGVAEKYLKKGSKCLVEGQIETRKWTDQSGQDRYTTEIVVRPYKGELVLLGDPGRDGAASGWGGQQRSAPANSASSAPASTSASRPLDDLDDEIPF